MSVQVTILNRQRSRRVDLPGLRRVTGMVLEGDFGLTEGELGVQLIGSRRMAALNWRWLRHEGSTDILTFDHREGGVGPLHGELFISVDDAVAQAGEYGTRPGTELFRYVVHGVLHLLGYDDTTSAARKRMKREENRVVRRWEASEGRTLEGLLGEPVGSRSRSRSRSGSGSGRGGGGRRGMG